MIDLPTRSVGATVLCAVAVACSLGPRPDSSRFYVLTSLAEAGPRAAAPPADRLALGVGPITLPGYLTRGTVVTRLGPNRVVFSGVDRWGEPLDRAFARTLAENLGVLVGTDRVRFYPWYASEPIDFQVTVDVARFERDSAGSVELRARWTVRDVEGVERAGGRAAIREPADDASTGAAVAAQSRALAELSREIAEAIRAARRSGR